MPLSRFDAVAASFVDVPDTFIHFDAIGLLFLVEVKPYCVGVVGASDAAALGWNPKAVLGKPIHAVLAVPAHFDKWIPVGDVFHVGCSHACGFVGADANPLLEVDSPKGFVHQFTNGSEFVVIGALPFGLPLLPGRAFGEYRHIDKVVIGVHRLFPDSAFFAVRDEDGEIKIFAVFLELADVIVGRLAFPSGISKDGSVGSLYDSVKR